MSTVFFARVQEGETFTKTSCYHYFHCHCLGRYVSHSESELRQREKELEEDKTRDRADSQVCDICSYLVMSVLTSSLITGSSHRS